MHTGKPTASIKTVHDLKTEIEEIGCYKQRVPHVCRLIQRLLSSVKYLHTCVALIAFVCVFVMVFVYVCLIVCLCVCVYERDCVSVFEVYQYVCVSVCLCVWEWVCINMCVCLSVSVPVCMRACPS